MCRACLHDASAALSCPERLQEGLRSGYLFRDLSEDDLARVAEVARSVVVRDGCWIYRQGERADRFYLVREGQVALFRQAESGKEGIVALIGPDELFAEELLVVEPARHDLNARAIGDVQLIAIERTPVRSLVVGSVELCTRLMQTLYQRQQMLLDEIERLTLHDATQRVMAYLLDQLGDRAESRLRLSVPKWVLASRLAIQPETLSRILGRLKECRYVREEGDALVLVQPDELREELRCSFCSLRCWGCPGPRRSPLEAVATSAAAS